VAQKCTLKVKIVNRLGLHARPAMSFVDLAATYSSDIKVCKADPGGDVIVDGKSIMEMMMLAAAQGTILDITAEGEDAEKACNELKKLVESGFDEE
jgi:phosphocarrier protein HPr